MAFNIQRVKASGSIYIRADGSIDPPDAPIITFDNVTYTLTDNITSTADGIVVERDNVIIDGEGFWIEGPGLFPSSGIWLGYRTGVTIKNINVKRFWDGIMIYFSSNNIIIGNGVTNNKIGIRLHCSSNNSIIGNSVTDNVLCGISLSYSSNNNSVIGNVFVANGLAVDDSYMNVVEGNTVNGKPLIYLEGVSNYTVVDAGQVVLVKCKNIRVENLNLSAASVGVQLFKTNNTIIIGNNIMNNSLGIDLEGSSNNNIIGNNITANDWNGILLLSLSNNNSIIGNNLTDNQIGISMYESLNNSILGNNIANNLFGILLSGSSSNSIYHNNFIGNTRQAHIEEPGPNIWDNGYPVGGNYWSNYTGMDLFNGPYQNETGSDGIGDTSYVIDENNTDHYPLMKPYPWAQHDVGITSVKVSKTIVGQGYSMFINVMVFNYGNDAENINVTIYANTTIIGENNNITIADRSSTILTVTWNTSGFAKGNYTLWAYAEPVQGETETTDNTFTDSVVYIGVSGDINGDGTVDIFDAIILSSAFGAKSSDPNWNPNIDFDNTNEIDIFDAIILSTHFGETNP
jgi:parallel beta-helix repeat protein